MKQTFCHLIDGELVAGRRDFEVVNPATGAPFARCPDATREEVDAAMGIPQGFHSYAILPIGYPMGRFGPVARGPLSDVVYLDGWGKPYPGI